MIRILLKSSFDRIKNSYFKVFSGNNPFEDCFSDKIKKINLLYPVDGYKLTRDQYTALIFTINNIYIDEEVVVSEIEAESIGDIFNPNNDVSKYKLKHWTFDVSTTYDEYMEMDINVENAIYSSKGNWGIIISHEEHAVIGGSAIFFDIFKTKYNEFDNSIERFQVNWEYNKKNYNSDIKWYEKFIESLNR